MVFWRVQMRQRGKRNGIFIVEVLTGMRDKTSFAAKGMKREHICPFYMVLFLVLCYFLGFLPLPEMLFISSFPHQLRFNIKN